MFWIKMIHFDLKVKNNKMLFNLRNWFKLNALIFNSIYQIIFLNEKTSM